MKYLNQFYNLWKYPKIIYYLVPKYIFPWSIFHLPIYGGIEILPILGIDSNGFIRYFYLNQNWLKMEKFYFQLLLAE